MDDAVGAIVVVLAAGVVAGSGVVLGFDVDAGASVGRVELPPLPEQATANRLTVINTAADLVPLIPAPCGWISRIRTFGPLQA